MDPLSQEQISSMLGLDELDRVNRTVLDDKPRQLIEKLEIESNTSPYSVVVLKYGHGKGICTEALAHQLLFQYEDPVAKLLFHTVLPNSTHVLVTEWAEGDSPDFTEQNTVQKVFYALGQWLGCFRIRVHSLEETWTRYGQQVVTEEEITRRLVASAKNAVRNPETLRSIGGEHLLNIYGHLATDWGRDIARRISITPTTFNPGDLSLHNILVDGTRTTFLDFESCVISPMSQVIDVLGEPWGSLPEGNLVETALDAYLSGWNSVNIQAQIDRDVFRQAHTCSRIFDKVTKQYDYWLLELSKDTRNPQFMTWAREATPDFLKVVEQYQALF